MKKLVAVKEHAKKEAAIKAGGGSRGRLREA